MLFVKTLSLVFQHTTSKNEILARTECTSRGWREKRGRRDAKLSSTLWASGFSHANLLSPSSKRGLICWEYVTLLFTVSTERGFCQLKNAVTCDRDICCASSAFRRRLTRGVLLFYVYILVLSQGIPRLTPPSECRTACGFTELVEVHQV